MKIGVYRLAELTTTITKGTTPTSLGMSFVEQGIGFLRVQNINDGEVIFEENVLHIDEKTHQTLKRSQIKSGDVLVSIAGSIGRAAVVPDNAPELNCNQAVAIVRVKEQLFQPYLRYWLESYEAQTQIRGVTVTGTIANLSLSQLGNLQIPLPPIETQKRIAAILDQAEALRSLRRQSIGQLDALARSIFLEMFGDPVTNPKGWDIRKLADFVDEFRYGSSNKSQATGKPILRIPNVVGGTLNLTELKTVPVDDAEFERIKMQDGDILFVRTNGNPDFVGRCAVFDRRLVVNTGFSEDEFVFASYLIRARISSKLIDTTFLREFLLGSSGRLQLRASCKTSAGQFNINIPSLSAISFPLPPLALQQEFADRIGAIEALKTQHRQSLAKMDLLFASLQHRAFRGEL